MEQIINNLKTLRTGIFKDEQAVNKLIDETLKLAEQKASQFDALVSDANGGHWQKCPKCDGQGIISKPPWINGDQNTWTASEGSYTCNLCNGQMVIKQ